MGIFDMRRAFGGGNGVNTSGDEVLGYYGHSEGDGNFMPEESHNREDFTNNAILRGLNSCSPLNDRKNCEVHSNNSRKVAFTLAETLITLGIIGVVAAITLSLIVTNYKKLEMVTRLKKEYSVLSQAFIMSVNENGPYSDWDKSNGKKYFDTYWRKYLKSVSDCKDYGCGYEVLRFDYVWRYLDGTPTTPSVYQGEAHRKTAKFEDGTFLLFLLGKEITELPEPANELYVDINGYKKPNTYGKDVFVFELTDKGVIPLGIDKTDTEIKADCKKNSFGGQYCAALLYKNNWEVPKNYPF